MKVAWLIGLITAASTSLANAIGSNTKCITKSEASAFVKDFSTVWINDGPNWEDVALKILTPDFVFKSGSFTSVRGGQVGNGDGTFWTGRAQFIAGVTHDSPLKGFKTDDVSVAGCNTIFWELRRQSDDGKTILNIQRLDMRFSQGKWVTYQSNAEFDSCAQAGGCPLPAEGDPSGNDNINRHISKSEATAFVEDFAKVWFQTVPNWETIAREIATPDFQLKSGAIVSLQGQTVGDGDALIFNSRAAWIQYLQSTPSPTDLQTEHIVVADGENTVFWQYRGRSNGRSVLWIERFDLRYVQGQWVAYLTEVEFDSCAFAGGPCPSLLP